MKRRIVGIDSYRSTSVDLQRQAYRYHLVYNIGDWRMKMAGFRDAYQYAPTLHFSNGEKYYPCELFFDGKRDILTNRERYDIKSDAEKLKMVCCYYSVISGLQYYIYEYWYYYTFNPYTIVEISTDLAVVDNHEHDYESVYVYVNKETHQAERIVLNQHFWHNIDELPNGEIKVFVERDGHGMFGRKNHWLTWLMDKIGLLKWEKGGLELKPERMLAVDDLRKDVMRDPTVILDTSGKLIGSDYDSSRIGRMFGPSVPWWRSHYYLPETLLKGLDRVVPDKIALAFKLPSTPPLSLLRSISLPQGYDSLDEAVKRALEIGMINQAQYKELRRRRLVGLPHGKRLRTAVDAAKTTRKARRVGKE